MSNFKDNSGLETIKPKTSKEERDRMMKKFLDKQQSTEIKNQIILQMNSLDKSKKPAFTKDDIDKGVKGRTPRPDYSTYKKGSCTMTMTWVVINHQYGKNNQRMRWEVNSSEYYG